MRRFCATIALILVAAGVLHAQGGPVEVLVVSRTQPAAASAAAAVSVTLMENAVQKELLRLFPCLSVTFASDIKTSLEFLKQRQLLNSDFDSGIDAMAGALGANYLFAFTVTDMPGGQLAMNGSLINTVTSKILSIKSSSASADAATKGGEAAWLARQLVPGLNGISRLAKDKCVPTNHWTGTVIYHAAETVRRARRHRGATARDRQRTRSRPTSCTTPPCASAGPVIRRCTSPRRTFVAPTRW